MATYILAMTSTTTLRSIKEVLLQTITSTIAKFWASATDRTALTVTSMCIVAMMPAVLHTDNDFMMLNCSWNGGQARPGSHTLKVWAAVDVHAEEELTAQEALLVPSVMLHQEVLGLLRHVPAIHTRNVLPCVHMTRLVSVTPP